MKRRTALALVSIVTAIGALSAPAGAAPAPASCGMVVLEDLKLHADLLCDGPGLLIGADGITVDLNGHLIQGAGTSAGIVSVRDLEGDPAPGYLTNDVTLRDGTVAGFSTGILLGGSGLRYQRLVVRDNSSVGIAFRFDRHLRTARAAELKKLTVAGNGIGIQPTGVEANIRDTTFVGNNSGIEINNQTPGKFSVQSSLFRDNDIAIRTVKSFNGLSGNVIARNEIVSNGEGIIIVRTPAARIEQNIIRDNDGAGIQVHNYESVSQHIEGNLISGNESGITFGRFYAYDFFRDSVVTRNRVVDNRSYGMSVAVYGGQNSTAKGMVVSDNDFTGNGRTGDAPGDGLLLQAGEGEVTVSNNRADDNGDLGIEAPGVVDGGRNRAAGNGNPAQCVGVVCRP